MSYRFGSKLRQQFSFLPERSIFMSRSPYPPLAIFGTAALVTVTAIEKGDESHTFLHYLTICNGMHGMCQWEEGSESLEHEKDDAVGAFKIWIWTTALLADGESPGLVWWPVSSVELKRNPISAASRAVKEYFPVRRSAVGTKPNHENSRRGVTIYTISAIVSGKFEKLCWGSATWKADAPIKLKSLKQSVNKDDPSNYPPAYSAAVDVAWDSCVMKEHPPPPACIYTREKFKIIGDTIDWWKRGRKDFH